MACRTNLVHYVKNRSRNLVHLPLGSFESSGSPTCVYHRIVEFQAQRHMKCGDGLLQTSRLSLLLRAERRFWKALHGARDVVSAVSSKRLVSKRSGVMATR
jgi:hypothetical protein